MALTDVSVIIPSFNRSDKVCKAVETCIKTQNCSVEIIIVDDGSTDNTKKVLRKKFENIFLDETCALYQDVRSNGAETRKESRSFPRIHYYYQENQGACAARNFGLQVATGQYVKFLDSDDELIVGSLSKELSFARKTKADVVVTGWQERTYDSDLNKFAITRHVQAPNIERGIDDMLRGLAPWTSAALYRKAFIEKLKWNPEHQKAQDWAWAWTVCLAGASFKTLNIESSIYNQYSGQRITSMGNPFLKSSESRQLILRMVEDKLREKGQLSNDRCRALVQYYYKDSKVLCEEDPSKWRKLWLHLKSLAPGFRPVEQNSIVHPFVKFFGTYWGIWVYVKLRKCARFLGFKHS